jgi:hypothetical protein
MRLRPLLALALLATAVVGTTAAKNAPASFDITLTRTAGGWSASCAAGCQWTQLSMDCAPGCQAVVSEFGLRTQRTDDLAKASFAFVVEPRGFGGWHAVALRGTAWSETSIGCGESRCSTRVDELGVNRR